MANKGKYYESQFEEATIELLREAHWQYTFGDDIHRKYTDPLIEEDLRNFLAVQYKDKNLTTSEMDSIVANLRNTGGQNDYYALRNAFLLYRDGYDFIAYEGSQYQDYMLAPLVVTIRNRRLDLASFHTKSDQRKFLKQLVKRELNQVGIDELVETVIDGHPALVIRESVKQLGVVTRAFLISHQRLLQITVSFTGNFTNTLEVTETIIKSFKVHSTPSPQNATLTTMESTYGKFELEVSRPFHADVQYVITLSPTGHFFMH